MSSYLGARRFDQHLGAHHPEPELAQNPTRASLAESDPVMHGGTKSLLRLEITIGFQLEPADSQAELSLGD